jgi:putative sterol carrier protein
MATAEEIREALMDYQVQCNANERLRRMQRDWSRVIHLDARDEDAKFTMHVVKGEIVGIEDGLVGECDIYVQATSEDFADMFWGDLNPSQKYLRGEIKVRGSQEDIMRLDAITSVIWPDV